jgi:hypothetical protein
VNRREILRSGSAALVALAIPGWAETFGQSPPVAPSDEKPSLLRRSIEGARTHGRPLLVLHVPRTRAPNDAVSLVWSAYLDEASGESLVDLALCDAVAVFDELVELDLPSLKGTEWKSGLAILVEPDDTPPAIVPAVPTDLRWYGPEPEFFAATVKLRHDLGERKALERRVRQNRAALNVSDIKLLGDLDSSIPVTRSHAVFVPAWALLRAEDDPRQRNQILGWLRFEAVLRYYLGATPGALWGRWSGGCGGVTLEKLGQQIGSGACGMAAMSGESRRFLFFYSEQRIEEMRRRK